MFWIQNNLANIITLLCIGLLIYICVRNLINDKKSGVPSCGAKSCASCLGKCGLYDACEMIANREKKKDMVN